MYFVRSNIHRKDSAQRRNKAGIPEGVSLPVDRQAIWRLPGLCEGPYPATGMRRGRFAGEHPVADNRPSESEGQDRTSSVRRAISFRLYPEAVLGGMRESRDQSARRSPPNADPGIILASGVAWLTTKLNVCPTTPCELI